MLSKKKCQELTLQKINKFIYSIQKGAVKKTIIFNKLRQKPNIISSRDICETLAPNERKHYA